MVADNSYRRMHRAGCAVAAACLLAALSGPALAAIATPPRAPANLALSPAQAQPGPAARRPAGPPSAANVEAGIAALRQRLRPTPAQRPLFEAVARAMRDNARAMRELPRPPRNARPSAVASLRLMLRFTEQQAEGLRQLISALEALYARLSPRQRQAADAFFGPPPRR